MMISGDLLGSPGGLKSPQKWAHQTPKYVHGAEGDICIRGTSPLGPPCRHIGQPQCSDKAPLMNPLGRPGPMELSQIFSLLFHGVLIGIADVPCMPMSIGHHAGILVLYMLPSEGP